MLSHMVTEEHKPQILLRKFWKLKDFLCGFFQVSCFDSLPAGEMIFDLKINDASFLPAKLS